MPCGYLLKHSDVIVRMHQSICFPQGMLWIVYYATLVSQLLFIPAPESHFLLSCQLYIAHANMSKWKTRSIFLKKLFLIAPIFSPAHLQLLQTLSLSQFVCHMRTQQPSLYSVARFSFPYLPLFLLQLVLSLPAAPWFLKNTFRLARCCFHGSLVVTACPPCVTIRSS